MENERRMQIGVMGSAQDLNYGKKIGEILAKEYAQILFRYQNPKSGSATTDMFSTPNGVETKLMEESFEVTKASMGKEGSRRQIEEIADVFYAITAYMVRDGLTFQDIACEMSKRQGGS